MAIFLKKHWPLVGLGFLLVLAASYALRAGIGLVNGPGVVAEVSLGDGLKLKDMHYTQDDPDREMKWTLDAKEVRFSQDQSFVTFDDFHLRLEPKESAPVTFTGKGGDYSRGTGVIRLHGDLDAVTEDGYRLLTETLTFNEKDRHLTTDKPVKIKGPFFSVEGEGLFVDLNRRTFKVLSGVTTIIEKGAPLS